MIICLCGSSIILETPKDEDWRYWYPLKSRSNAMNNINKGWISIFCGLRMFTPPPKKKRYSFIEVGTSHNMFRICGETKQQLADLFSVDGKMSLLTCGVWRHSNKCGYIRPYLLFLKKSVWFNIYGIYMSCHIYMWQHYVTAAVKRPFSI